MFRLFRRRKDKPSVMYSMFQKIGTEIDKIQRQFANYLNNKASKLTAKQLLTGLIFFCMAFGGSAGLIIWQAVDNPDSTVSVQSISVPRHTIPDEEHASLLGLTKAEINNILQFQHSLDSLPKTKLGKATYDSIRHYRAGLFDSLSLLEQMYHEQLKTK